MLRRLGLIAAIAPVMLVACSSSSDSGKMVGCQIGGTSVALYVQGSTHARFAWDGWVMHGKVYPITEKGVQVDTPKEATDGGDLSVVYLNRDGKNVKAIGAKCTKADHGLTGAVAP